MLLILLLLIAHATRECTSTAPIYLPDYTIEFVASKHFHGYIPLSTQSDYENPETCDIKILTLASVWLRMWTIITDCYMFSVQDIGDSFVMDYDKWEDQYLNDLHGSTNGTTSAVDIMLELPQAHTIRKFVEELIEEIGTVNGRSAILSAGDLLKAHLERVVSHAGEVNDSFKNKNCSFESFDDQLILYEFEYLVEEAADTHNGLSDILSLLHDLEKLNTRSDRPKREAAWKSIEAIC